MSEIWMDPTELRNSASTLAEQAQRIQETVTGTRTTCQCEVPRSLIGWLDAELIAITEDALRVAIGYLIEAVDAQQRANQLATEQSLATTQPALLGTTTIGGTAPGADFAILGGDTGLRTTMTLGGLAGWSPSDASGADTGLRASMTIGGSWSTPLLDAARNLESRNPAAAAQLLGLQGSLSQSNANMVGTWVNSRPGAAYIGDGLYSGASGRIGTISDVFPVRGSGGRYDVA